MRYQIKRNRCNCHPETCCHFDYYIYDTETNERVQGTGTDDEDSVSTGMIVKMFNDKGIS